MTRKDVDRAAKKAKAQIKKTGGFDDLLSFTVEAYTSKELRAMGIPDPKWLGKYQSQSINDPEEGLTLYINLDLHTTIEDLTDTVRHEIGHGLWDLIDTKDRVRWLEEVSYDEGPLEAFADEFMWLTAGRPDRMLHRKLFMDLVRSE